jgi:TrkA domain protein
VSTPPDHADQKPLTVEEVQLPGVGVRHDFETRQGRRVGVVSHRGGRRDLLVYDPRDLDRCSESVPLTPEEADALAELLGAPRIVERLAALHEQVAGLSSEQLPLAAGSPYAGRTLADTQARTRTGASIVAVLRQDNVFASPQPDFRFQAGDVVIVVGTKEGIEGVERILAG